MWPGALLMLAAAAEPAAETMFWQTDFEGADALAGWTGAAGGRLVPGPDGQCLLIERPADAGVGSTAIGIDLPVEALRGRRVTWQADVRVEAVSAPPQPWNGVKLMLVIERADGGKSYPQADIPEETSDWRTYLRTERIPADATRVFLHLGLEQVMGRAWYDRVRVYLGRPAGLPTGRRREVRFRPHPLDRLRGVMHGPRFVEENLRHLGEDWRANQVRWQLNWTPMKDAETWAADLDAFDRWLEGALSEADQAAAACEKYGLLMLLDLHTPPGGRAGGGVCRMFSEQRYQDKLVEVWRKLATRYRGNRTIYGYDLLNEPVEGRVAEGLLDWRGLAQRVGEVIHEIDPDKALIVEPGNWGSPGAFDSFVPLDLDNVVYSCHMYIPHHFTHQGVHGLPVGLEYPGVIDGRRWDKEQLREALQPARDFELEYNVPIYVGEFSAIRWAPNDSAYRYLRDVIDIFEEWGWDWSYHAYREWSGWSVEYTSDPEDNRPAAEPTNRQQLLTSWFARNERPH